MPSQSQIWVMRPRWGWEHLRVGSPPWRVGRYRNLCNAWMNELIAGWNATHGSFTISVWTTTRKSYQRSLICLLECLAANRRKSLENCGKDFRVLLHLSLGSKWNLVQTSAEWAAPIELAERAAPIELAEWAAPVELAMGSLEKIPIVQRNPGLR